MYGWTVSLSSSFANCPSSIYPSSVCHRVLSDHVCSLWSHDSPPQGFSWKKSDHCTRGIGIEGCTPLCIYLIRPYISRAYNFTSISNSMSLCSCISYYLLWSVSRTLLKAMLCFRGYSICSTNHQRERT